MSTFDLAKFVKLHEKMDEMKQAESQKEDIEDSLDTFEAL